MRGHNCQRRFETRVCHAQRNGFFFWFLFIILVSQSLNLEIEVSISRLKSQSRLDYSTPVILESLVLHLSLSLSRETSKPCQSMAQNTSLLPC